MIAQNDKINQQNTMIKELQTSQTKQEMIINNLKEDVINIQGKLDSIIKSLLTVKNTIPDKKITEGSLKGSSISDKKPSISKK